MITLWHKNAVLLIVSLLFVSGAFAQEEQQVVLEGRRYLDINIRALDKYNQRIERQQQRLLAKLKRKETKLAARLKHSDSAAYVRYQQQSLSYDSIGRMLRPDSATLVSKTKHATNKIIDSLRGVESFINGTAAKANIGGVDPSKYGGDLSKLQQQLSYHEYINRLISQRTSSLKSLGANIPGLQNIEQDVFYGKARMNTWKQIADDPSLAEQKALEYLQGTEGFDKQLSQSTIGANSMQALSGASSSDLEKMGFQTKDQLNNALQQKFGSSLSNVQQQMGGQLNDWQNKAHDITQKISDAKSQVADAKSQLGSTKSRLKAPVNLNKNSMRGLPFKKRLEKQYNWQTTRATPDGQPAMLQGAAMVGFRHTPKLSYGIGTALSIGLGQDWNHIHFSFEGIGLRSYLQYQLIYGIGLYGGYERTYKQEVFTTSNETTQPQIPTTTHNTSNYNESLLLGLTKNYRMNSKWNGQIQVMYDAWWKDKGLRSPIVLRFATSTSK
jgi:hypothetical protein